MKRKITTSVEIGWEQVEELVRKAAGAPSEGYAGLTWDTYGHVTVTWVVEVEADA